MKAPLPLPQITCQETMNRHHDAKNNTLHPTAEWMMNRWRENIVGASVEHNASHPRQTSCEEVSDAC